MRKAISTVTLIRSSEDKLPNLVKQLEQCSVLPEELVVVWLISPNALSLLKSERFKIIHKFIANDELAIAKAFNRGINATTHTDIAFIDVNTVFPIDLLQCGQSALINNNVAYTHDISFQMDVNDKAAILPPHLSPLTTSKNTAHAANSNVSAEPFSNEIKDIYYGKPNDHRHHFAVFFISKADFEKTRGFDEAFTGVELIIEDFIAKCYQSGLSFVSLPIFTITALSPVAGNKQVHFFNMVMNTKRFYHKWGHYPNKALLKRYAEAGIINKGFEDQGILFTCQPDITMNKCVSNQKEKHSLNKGSTRLREKFVSAMSNARLHEKSVNSVVNLRVAQHSLGD